VKVAIPAIQCGNFASVINIIGRAGGTAELVHDPKQLERFDRVILAGVGAFDFGMACLETGGWVDPLNRLARGGNIPILGICLGMQLLCRRSDEGVRAGLGWIPADVVRIEVAPQSGLKVPHMGWNTVSVHRPNPIMPFEGETPRYYFVHSFHAVCDDSADVIASTMYGKGLAAALGRGNVLGVQFHPEKSHRFGLSLIRRFLEWSC
jgi:glutamine amidotransferase